MAGHGWLIVYRADPKSRTRKNQLIQKLHGQVTYTRGERYWRRGLLEDLPHERVGRGIVLVRERDGPAVIKLLRPLAAEVEWWRVMLRPKDQRVLTKAPAHPPR